MISNVTGAVVGRGAGRSRRTGCVTCWRPCGSPTGWPRCAAMGFDAFVEIGPHPVLTAMGQGCVRARRRDVGGVVAPGPRRPRAVLARRWRRSTSPGSTSTGAASRRGTGRRRVALPTYPFERQPSWVPAPPPHRRGAPSSDHPLLGRRLRSPLAASRSRPSSAVDTSRHPRRPPGLRDARSCRPTGVPRAGPGGRSRDGRPRRSWTTSSSTRRSSPRRALVTVQTIVTPDAAGASFEIFGQLDGDDHWTRHASGRHRRRRRGAGGGRLWTRRHPGAGALRRGGRPPPSTTRCWRPTGSTSVPACAACSRIWMRRRRRPSASSCLPGRVGRGRSLRASTRPCSTPPSRSSPTSPATARTPTCRSASNGRASARRAPAATAAWSHVGAASGLDLAERPETHRRRRHADDADGTVVASIDGLRLKRADAATLQRIGRPDRTDEWLLRGRLAARRRRRRARSPTGSRRSPRWRRSPTGRSERLRDEHEHRPLPGSARRAGSAEHGLRRRRARSARRRPRHRRAHRRGRPRRRTAATGACSTTSWPAGRRRDPPSRR